MKVGNKMKRKLLVAGLCVAMALSIAGCSGSKDKESKKVASSGEITTDESGNLMAGKTATKVKLCEYKGMKIGRSTEEIEQDKIDDAINNILSSFATTEKVLEGTVKDGDVVNIDYTGTIEGTEFEGGSADGYDLTIGSGSFIEGFEDGLIGANIGDTVTLNLTFPDTYSGKTEINGKDVTLAGTDVTFEVKLNYVTVSTNPELTDDFVAANGKDYGDSKTVDELNAYVKDQIALGNKLKTLWPEILAGSEIEIDAYEKQEKYSELYLYYENMIEANYGKDLETYVKDYGTTMDDFKQSIQDEAEYQIKCQAVSNAIARAENITITPDEYQAKADDDMEYYGYSDIEEYQKKYPKQETIDSLIYYKVLEFIGENSVVVDDAELETETETQTSK